MSFFKTLQDHSEVKLSILEKYTIPWMRKITLNPYGSKKCLIIDGFAGAGTYENGKDGSPIILIKNAIDFYSQSIENNWKPPLIYLYLNELEKSNYTDLQDLIKNLGFNNEEDSFLLSKEYPTIIIKLENKTFEKFITDLLSDIKDGYSLIPSFCFVDPFGFSTTPFKLFINYLRNQNAELLINFIYEETNRFINHPNEKIRNRISEHIGLVNLDDLSKQITGLKPAERKRIITETYTENIMNQTEATFVRSFELKKQGRTKMILFHITKNIHGLKLMKETMWKHDETGSYTYDNRNNFIQLDFDSILKNDKKEHILKLSEEIEFAFKSKKNIFIEDIEEFVITETIYPTTNFLKPALKILENNDTIFNFRGRKRIKSYPKNTRMDFK